MADADQLTAEYRSGQLATRAKVLKQVGQMWPMLDITNLSGTLEDFAVAAARLVLAGWLTTAGDTAAFLESYRLAAGVAGGLAFPTPAAPTAPQVAGLIRGAAASGIVNARRRGADQRRAMDNGLVKVLGQAGRTALDGGRSAVVQGARRDPKAAGWERETSPGACDFCLMLAARGPAYTSDRSASFEAHGHCGCTGRLRYEPSVRSAQLAEEWTAVTRGLSGAAARAAWRRHVDSAPPLSSPAPARTRPPAAAPAREVPFAERLAAAATEQDALAAARFGLGRGKDRDPAFTSDMSKAVNTYTGAEYAAINAVKRDTRMPYGYTADDVADTIRDLGKAFAGSQLSRDVVAYRGLIDARSLFGDLVDGDLTGMEFREDAPMSATVRRAVAVRFSGRREGSLVMRVLVPAGTHAVEASGMQLEAELLIADGSRVRVVADRGVNPEGVREIDVEVIGRGR